MRRSTPYLLFLLISFYGIAYAAEASDIPQIDFEYAAPFDYLICPELPQRSTITPEMQSELQHLLPLIQSEWNLRGAEFLRQTVALTKVPFQKKEQTVTLTLCRVPSITFPLLVSIRETMKTFSKTPKSSEYRLNIIFHELLHHYLLTSFPKILSGPSPLWKKYEKEGPVVQTHLHLFAIQKEVYSRLGKDHKLQNSVAQLSDPQLQRAWEIVTQVEGPGAFIRELRPTSLP